MRKERWKAITPFEPEWPNIFEAGVYPGRRCTRDSDVLGVGTLEFWVQLVEGKP